MSEVVTAERIERGFACELAGKRITNPRAGWVHVAGFRPRLETKRRGLEGRSRHEDLTAQFQVNLVMPQE